MTSIIKVEPFSGVYGHGPLCYMLTIDDVKILLDCGWDENFDMEYIKELERQLPKVNAVLISYGDVPHCGALPYLVGKLGLKCPIYATVPGCKMGQLALYDWLHGHLLNEEFELFSYDDIDAVYERVEQLKYNQTALLRGDNGLQITALPAGHMLGGAIWKITKMGDEDIVYAVDYNHKKDRHLNGCTFEGIEKPALMITDAFNSLYIQPNRKGRDEQLITTLLSTLRDGGDCLLVIDTSGRVLEIAHLLDQMWQNPAAGLNTYNLVMLSSVATSVIEGAKSQIEWMADKIQRAFESGRINPFHLKSVKCCHSTAELNKIRSPKVVLVSGLDMESGLSREIFIDWSIESRNTCIVTGRSMDGSLGSKLVKMSELREAQKPCDNTLLLRVKQRVKLDGVELNAFWNKRRAELDEAKRQRQEAKRRRERDELLDESDSDDEDEVAAANAVARVRLEAEASAKNESNRMSLDSDPNVADKDHSTMQQQQLQQKQQFYFNKQKLKVPYQIKMTYGDVLQFFYSPESENFAPTVGPLSRYGGIKRKKIAFSMTLPKPPQWDEFGETIDPEDYTILDEVKKRVADVHQNSDDSDNENETVYDVEVPTKCTVKTVKLEVTCKIHFIDFEGRSDGKSLKKLLEGLQPRKLVIVHASKNATNDLVNFCIQNNVVKDKDQVYAPRLNEVVDCTVESRIAQVKLGEHLMKSLKFQKIRDLEVCWVNAKLVRRNPFGREDSENDENVIANVDVEMSDSEPKEAAVDEPMETEDETGVVEVENEPVEPKRMKRNPEDDRVLVLETLSVLEQKPHRSIYIDDPKLSDVKTFLNKEGLQAEFNTGTLFVENVAVIQRTTAGVFAIEGRTCMALYKIRDLVSQQFAVI